MIATNNGTLAVNDGTVSTNAGAGTVALNSGTVSVNEGMVTENQSIVGHNKPEGIVWEYAAGIIDQNEGAAYLAEVGATVGPVGVVAASFTDPTAAQVAEAVAYLFNTKPQIGTLKVTGGAGGGGINASPIIGMP